MQEFTIFDCQKIQKTINNKWKTFPITDEPNVTQTSCLLLKIRSWTVNKQKKKLFHYVSSLRFLKGEFCLETLPFHPEELRVLSVVGFDEKKRRFHLVFSNECQFSNAISSERPWKDVQCGISESHLVNFLPIRIMYNICCVALCHWHT